MSLNKLLIRAVVSVNVEETQRMIDSGADVNYREHGTRSTPVLLAVVKRNLEIVTILIDAGAKVNVTNSDGFTPLIMAVRNNDLEIVRKLCEAHDFSIDVLSTIGNCFRKCSMPLHVAVERGNVEMVRFLLLKGAPLTDMDSCMNTPLHSAVTRVNLGVPNLDILKELVKHKRTIGDLNVVNGNGETALQTAVAHRLKSRVTADYFRNSSYPLDVMRILVLQGAKVTGINCYLYTSPLSAAMNFYDEDPACTQALVKYGMFVYATKSSWQSICNLNEYQFDKEVCQEALIKYCTLKYADELILKIIETFHESSFYPEVVVFVNKCETEIENMKNYNVNGQFSLYEVLLQCLIYKREDFFSVIEGSQEVVLKVIHALCCSRFPIYCDVISSAFYDKTHLQLILMNYHVFTWKLNSTKVKLNQECLVEIMQYLSVTDLVNFTVAYVEFHEYLSKTVINNISCITIED